MLLLNSAVAIAVVLTRASSVASQLYDTVIETQYGKVQGAPAFSTAPNGNITNWQDITVWKGIPFAASTDGENRFRPPQKRAAWNETLNATSYGGVCPQDFTLDDGLYYSEDCLNLNIWTSGNSTTDKRPVVIWSYPAESTAAQPLFDGAGMAAQGIVFVNYNYRAGALGWLALAELSEEMQSDYGTNSSGNWGVLDQFAALKWVHENIDAFGGDPDHITAMGQSAGSAATQHMLNSPLTKGLIVGAIIESGVRDPHDPLAATLAEGYQNQSTALATGESYMSSLNASSVADLRALNYTDLLVGFRGGYSFGAVLDYYALPERYWKILQNGAPNQVPILTGNTRDESGAVYNQTVNVTAYEAALEEQYGSYWAAEFLDVYPADNTSQASIAANAHYTDTSKVGTWLWSKLWHQASSTNVYTYLWTHAPPGQSQGAYHESEINYVLNNLYGTDLPWEQEDYEIAMKMNAYWANFAKTGNPNKGSSYATFGYTNLTTFPRWTAEENVTMELGDGWGDVPIAGAAQIQVIGDYFDAQVPL